MTTAAPVPQLPYDRYLDKVYGCWMGKSLGGTLGAPYEGRKELFNYTFDRSAVAIALPNDDLDLQVLWIHVLEQKGLHFTTRDLAEAFANLVPYAPGEYAIFKKNYARGLYPPLTGAFNNAYYINGMGCPIRSEVWACICPGNPQKAADFASRDGILDHEGDSVLAEKYLCAIEAAAFLTDDLNALLTEALPWMPEGTRIRRVIDDVMRWCDETEDWREVWRRIIRDYGHPDCTNLYQNMGITILALKHGGGDFIKTLMIATNCGFDADCTCATSGAILGIICGAKGLAERYGFTDPSYKLSIPLERKSYRLDDLAAETCRIGVACTEEFTPGLKITHAPVLEPLPIAPKSPWQVEVSYGKDPVIGWGETKSISIEITASDAELRGEVTLTLPQGWTASWLKRETFVAKNGRAVLPVDITVPKSVRRLDEINLLKLNFVSGATQLQHTFGLVGAQVWKVYGPYWKNWIDLPQNELGRGYFDTFPKDTPDNTSTLTRAYHINTLPRLEVAEIVEPDGAISDPAKLHLTAKDFIVAQTREDKFAVGNLIGFQGPCMVYAERSFHCPEERTVHLQVGHSDAYKLWLNGKLVSSSDSVDWWHGENALLGDIKLLKGENHLLLKLVRRSAEASISVVFTIGGSCTKHICDLGTLIPEDIG